MTTTRTVIQVCSPVSHDFPPSEWLQLHFRTHSSVWTLSTWLHCAYLPGGADLWHYRDSHVIMLYIISRFIVGGTRKNQGGIDLLPLCAFFEYGHIADLGKPAHFCTALSVSNNGLLDNNISLTIIWKIPFWIKHT